MKRGRLLEMYLAKEREGWQFPFSLEYQGCQEELEEGSKACFP